MKKPFVSIVVASYNRKYIINESIQSILSQNYPEDSFEVIVVDNNSNDGTVSEIKKIFSREIDNKKIKLLDLKLNSDIKFFDKEISKYSYMWKQGGQFSKEKV